MNLQPRKTRTTNPDYPWIHADGNSISLANMRVSVETFPTMTPDRAGPYSFPP
jgi:hypothetical protein